MAAHSALIDELDQHCERLLSRTDELKRYLIAAKAMRTQDSVRWTFLEREARATAIVCSMAELESLTRETIRRTHQELNSSALENRALTRCLRQLAAHDAFESLRYLQDHEKVWTTRFFATTLDASSDVLGLPLPRKGPQPPLDGRTLKPSHFYRIWEIYGLPAEAFPMVRWVASLQKLSMLRNDIAHANVPFPEIFKQAGVSTSEVESYVDDISSFALHFTSCWQEFLERKLYLQDGVRSQ